ncbi:inorganic pyrophosphatase [Desulfitibacter alkalitolerans]|uniref:inorganic pyrophosphatase n=1 Tax=Desulfitibacter alkalitolerans TaxID=264641 RepID=UPI000487C7C4|nr:inorganic pyrophosphatase [Desulfitibacter alkalitolerans]
MGKKKKELWEILGMLFRAHPWHGVSLGDEQPQVVTAYIELVPSDTVKYEIDKYSGHLKVDRPQTYSNICPTLYGMLPQTYSGERVAGICNKKTGRTDIVGDRDPLDICVLTEKLVPHGDILLKARPIGGFRMLDGGEADDKIIAVMKNDALYENWSDIQSCPSAVIERLEHYFLTYKQAPGSKKTQSEILGIYGRDEAYEIIEAAHADYADKYGDVKQALSSVLKFKP